MSAGVRKAGAVNFGWFEIYRSQVPKLQMGFSEPDKARFFMLCVLYEMDRIHRIHRIKTWLKYKYKNIW